MNYEESMRKFILSQDKPVVFHNMIDDWKVLSWNLQDWSKLFEKKLMPFRCGNRQCSSHPQWERQCSTELMTMESFIAAQKVDKQAKDPGRWFYFDYKYINKWVPEVAVDASLQSISWKKFGFSEIDASGSTLWIGSVGAHTPCHMDTYGCNLVAQLYGKKQWILFPPEEHKALKITRVPYEESSIYSQWNFNSPLPQEFFDKIKCVHIVTLNPGDVLFVPRHWWHFVENIESSVSINTWIPLEEDHVSRVDESLVRFFISHVSNSFSQKEKDHFLNPNEDDLDSNKALNLVRMSVSSSFSDESNEGEPIPKRLRESSSQADFKPENVDEVPRSTAAELKVLLDAKCSCDSAVMHKKMIDEVPVRVPECQQSPDSLSYLSKLINAFCHPDVIRQVREQAFD